MNIKNRGKLIGVSIFLVSILMTLIFNRFDNEFFICDDNVTQWYPVMETAYSEFFETGTMPVYDFYQFKGLNTLEPGYYGITNPIMFLCYVITRFLGIPITCITFYIILFFSLGNVTMYAILKELKCGDAMAVIGVLAYSSFSVFFYKFIWYYVFNNFLIIPLIVYTMIKCRDHIAKYFSVGIILAIDIYLGNIQYTFYHYMLYGILSVGVILFAERKYIKAMFANFCAGLCLSVPVFILVLDASQGFNPDANDFLVNNIEYYHAILYCFIPFGILQAMGADPSKPPFAIGEDNVFSLYTAACTVPILVMCFILLKAFFKNSKTDKNNSGEKDNTLIEMWEKIKKHFTKQKRQIFILLLALIIFADISCGGIVAHILSIMPLVKQFRYLFKAMFVLVPVYVIFSMLIINNRPPHMRKRLACICLIFGIVGCINNFFVVGEVNKSFNLNGYMKYSEKTARAFDSISTSEMDLKNYRAVCIFESMRVDESKTDNYFENLSRNFPTALNTFSLSGYEISISDERLQQFDNIMPSESFITKYANGSNLKYFFESLEEHPDDISRELISNSVKYLIFPRMDKVGIRDCTGFLVDGLNALDKIEVVRIGSFSKKYNFIEISEVTGICTDENGNLVPFDDERMDLLSVKVNGINELRFSLAYNKGLTAYSVDGNGNKNFFAVSETEDGNISIDVSSADGQIVYLGYSKRVYGVAFVFEAFVFALFAANVALVILIKNKDGVKK